MKESILDVLLYLFEHYFANDATLTGDDFTALDSPLVGELTEAGFSGAEIEQVIVAALYAAHGVDMPVKDFTLRQEIRATRPTARPAP